MDSRLTPPGYVLPRHPRWQGGWNLRSLLGAVRAFILNAWIATEWIAYKLQNPIELGDPLAVVNGFSLFQPFGGVTLWVRFAGARQLGPPVRALLWIDLGITLAGGVIAACMMYWFLSLIRDRNSNANLGNLHGSAIWADRKIVEETGLLNAPDGAYVGGWKDAGSDELHFLLHNGPEHILLSAPTRSGKGVSCIIPTLLQWKQPRSFDLWGVDQTADLVKEAASLSMT